MSSKITVLLADDHHLVRHGFRRLLEDEPDMEVIGEASNGLEAISETERLRPRIVVMDMSMPELDGVQAILEIRRRTPETEVLVLSMYNEPSYVRNARDAGAKGYLLKNSVDVDLPAAIRAVASGRSFYSEDLPKETPQTEDSADPVQKLTRRELQVLQLIAQARSNKEIAQILNLSVNTVNVHRTNLMNALNLHSTAELVLFAVQRGLVTLPNP